MLRIAIDTDNAAFDDDPGAECARILRELAGSLEVGEAEHGDEIVLRDVNGNHVGNADWDD